ncbi:MAG TPA: PHP domain-containing protein [Steroidobacteraceae bacterium]|nr:PHP domain-containing protein [Steroidobacteraceae bacterium]
MLSRIDLHTHSDRSDGALAPAALVARAAARQVALLALTDHDTLAGCSAARAACEQHGIEFLSGLELTCEWRGREVHVVGLAVNEADSSLRDHCCSVLTMRRERIHEIACRLSAAGLPGEALAEQALAVPAPTRTHIARAMCAAGLATSIQRAFDRWLKRGQPGYVAQKWPELATVVRCVLGAGGIAVLAHPHRYKVSNGVLRELVAEFRDAGGGGIEVSLPGMEPADTDRAATLARRFDLAGSVGSDFHEPDLPWRPLGRLDKLPEGVRPITAHLGPVNGRS